MPNSSATVAPCQWSKPMGPSGVDSLSYCFTFGRSVMKAGQTVSATLAIKNSSGHTIAFSDGPPGQGCAINVQTALNGSHLTITPAFPDDCELQPILATGITTLQVPVSTTYSTCTMTEQPTQTTPTCIGNGGMPPLPTGDYTVTLVASSGDPFTQVAPKHLNLTN
ncbi:hypothetical protein BKA23_0303 [Rudaeicoccus suwonensis]|uniref:Uncharacterized protein n=2 Tax=Rudaeicoccus suwonensis TaxID=657409 RepID=A0A561E7J1_9MICO|nr:hypothetical protein BKA23_0303 [Rudaeicoccus suwonensis]